MLMEDTSSVMDWLSPVPLGLRNGRQGDSGRVARHSTFTGELLTQLPVHCGGIQIYRVQKRYKNETRFARRARVGTDRLPVVAPRPLPLPKRHITELGHHARVARDRACHARARQP